MKKYDKYFIEKNIDRFYKIGYTFFLDTKELSVVKKALNHNKTEYQIYEPFIDSDYKIIFSKQPEISCLKIITDKELTHQSIMGSLYNFNINENYIGDIIINNGYYFIILNEIKDYILKNFNTVGNNKIKLKESIIPIKERLYETLELIVSSTRIDTIVSRITNQNRKEVDNIITRKEVILNNEILTNKSYNLKENDIFSIKRYGKYKYIKIIKTTKKDNPIIEVKKYI